MRLHFDRYVIATREFPLRFDNIDECGEFVDDIESAYLYDTEEDIVNELLQFDDPEIYQSLKIKVTYEF